MKSLWKYLVNSTLIIACAGVAQTLVAQEFEEAGVVRISSAKMGATESGQLTPVSATYCDGRCGGSTPGQCGPNGCNSGGCNSGACNPGMLGNGYGRRGLFQSQSRYSNCPCDGYGNGASAGYGNGAQNGYVVDGGYGNGAYGGGRYGRYGGLGQGGLGHGGLGHGGLGHGGWGHGYCPSGCPNQNGAALCNYLHCKFGYFCPSGGGGQGLPWCGHYARVYPLNPYNSDPRDGQAWAAQGFGVPISVPLAPVVANTYEYGWGLPSSRIVPVSRPAY